MFRAQRPRPVSSAFRAGALGVALLGVAACSSSLPKPPTGPVPPDSLSEEVPYPPPPARVQTIPPRKSAQEVWVNGQWEWDGKDWKWLAGEWKTPPANAYFTPWMAARRDDGKLYFARATWRARDGRALDSGLGNASCPSPTATGEVKP